MGILDNSVCAFYHFPFHVVYHHVLGMAGCAIQFVARQEGICNDSGTRRVRDDEGGEAQDRLG